MSLRGLIAAAATLGLAACQERAAHPEPAPAAPAQAPPAAEQPAERWSLQASAAAGAAVILSDASGERLRIACRRNPADLFVSAPALTPIGSEERLTLGAGDELAVLVVEQGLPEGAPLQAVGAMSPAWVEAMAAGRPVAVSYGAQQVKAPELPADVRAAFAQGCREAARP